MTKQKCIKFYTIFKSSNNFINSHSLIINWLIYHLIGEVYKMKKNISENRNLYHHLNAIKKQYKSSSVNKEFQQVHKRTLLSDNSINFDINSFPFMNEQSKSPKIYRSTVKLKLSEEQLRRIARLNHTSLINILKITSGHSKLTSKAHQQEVYYSFYYEQVSYSLKYVAMYQDTLNNILKKMAQINLTKLLVNLSDYLIKFGIYYVFNLADIGVNKQGQIKIYVSPMYFCEQSCAKVHKSQIYGSIDKIVAWWETTLASNTALNPRSSHIILPSEIGLQDQTSIDYINKDHQQSFIDKEVSQLLEDNQEEKFHDKPQAQVQKDNQLNHSNKYAKSDFQKINSQQYSKIKKIDQQIKYIRQRLKEKRKKHKVSDSFLQKKDKNRVGIGLVESDRFLKKDFKDDKNVKQDSNIIETIQQNINCINIYTHPKQKLKEHQLKTKKMTSQPLYSYKISPQDKRQAKAKTPQVVIHHPSFDPEDFPNSQSISSIDTYDMEVQAEIHPAKAVQKNNAFINQRQISEKNYRPSFQSQQAINKKNPNQNQNQNQVVNKHVTQSAGPLQFKNFVNKYIKPQFLAKKSNIYEDPLEYESQTSKSISKKKKKIITDLYENGKSANSHTQKSSSLNNNPQQSNCKKKDNVFIVNNISAESSHQNTKNIYNRTNSEIKLITVLDQRNESQFQRRNKCLNQSKINQRVKLVLEKTKNAIALLNRVKNCRSPQFNQKNLPNKSSQLY